MFGLSFEKLFLVAIIAGLVLGPHRLPGYAHQLGQYVRNLRNFVDATRSAAERDMGISLQRTEWESLDLRQYDPRRIVSDALRESPARPPEIAVTQELLDEASRVRPGQKYLITGTSSHPRRISVDSLPVDDPRRIAAQSVPVAPSE